MARDPELWRRIRDDYLATGASYSELAKRHGVSLSKVKHVAAKEMWTSGGINAINTAEDARKTAGRSLNRIEPSNEPEGQIEPIPIEPGEPIEPEAPVAVRIVMKKLPDDKALFEETAAVQHLNVSSGDYQA